MPPTPPHDSVLPSSPTGVHGLNKRVSSKYLTIPSAGGHCSRSSLGCSPSQGSMSSASAVSQDSDSLIDDGESSSRPIDPACGYRRHIRDTERAASRKFTLMPVPARAYHQSRISSTSSGVTTGSDGQGDEEELAADDAIG